MNRFKKRKRGIFYWFINYLLFGYTTTIILMLIVKFQMPEFNMTTLNFFVLVPLEASIIIFPIFYFIKIQVFNLIDVYKGSTWGLKIFLILGVFGVVYRSCWDYNRTERYRKNQIKQYQVEKKDIINN